MTPSSTPPPHDPPSAAILSTAWEIPVDYKIKASRLGFFSGTHLTIFDAYDALAFKLRGESRPHKATVLFDAKGNRVITIVKTNHHGECEWQGYRGNSLESKDLIFTAHKVLDSTFKTEIAVNLSGEKTADSKKPSFRLKGSPFQKSCTMYKENSVVAQTNLLYKLRKFLYSTRKFRLTVFPGNEHALIIAMLATFLG